MTLTPARDLVRFGPFELDPTSWQLRRSGIRVRLPQQPLQLLALLLERPGAVVTREELQRRLWPSEVFVDFDHGINKNIQKLREALADSADSPAYIETIPRIGYRFIGVLADPPKRLADAPPSLAEEVKSGASAPEQAAAAPPPAFERSGIGRNKLLWVLVIAGVPSLAAWLVHRRPETAPIHSLAVLPMANLSGDPNQDYFAEGMTDELITELASIPDLRVVSRTSVMQEKGANKPLRQIARELDVDAVVEGSVVRQGDKVRITAQLIDARADKHLWARSFEDRANDILALQDNVAREIAAQAKFALSPKSAAAAQPTDPAAQDAYLRGLYFLHRRDTGKSEMYFQQAISLAPRFAAAYAGIAQVFTLQNIASMDGPSVDRLSKAYANAKRAIELDPECGEAYTAVGEIELMNEHNFATAQSDMLRGITLRPNNPLAETTYGIYLIAMNRTEEAVTHMRRAVKLDPLSFITNRLLGSALYFDRQYDESLHSLQLAAELNPDRADLAQDWMTLVYEEKGMFPQAVDADLSDMNEPYATTMRSAFRKGGWPSYQQARIKVLSRADKGCFAYEIGVSYLRLGDRDRALPPLYRAIDDQCFWTLWFKASPQLDSLRSDSRYPDLLRRAKLPE